MLEAAQDHADLPVALLDEVAHHGIAAKVVVVGDAVHTHIIIAVQDHTRGVAVAAG